MNILLNCRYFFKYRAVKRKYRNLKNHFAEYRQKQDSEKKALTAHYELQLAMERTRNESLHAEWANRFLQLQKLSGLGVTTSLIEERAALKLPEALRTLESNDEESLSPSQYLEYQDRKQLFYQQGAEIGKSPSEINNRWEDVKQQIVADIRMAAVN
jgi:hypothetical protein